MAGITFVFFIFLEHLDFQRRCYPSEIASFARHLLSRYLTERVIRAMNSLREKIPAERFPHNKKICASMPD
jgi:hypothetical protein